MHAQLAPTDFSDTFLSTEHLWPPPGRTKTCCRLHVPKKRGKETRKDEKPTATLAGGSNRTAIELHAAECTVPQPHKGAPRRPGARDSEGGRTYSTTQRDARPSQQQANCDSNAGSMRRVSCMHPEVGNLQKRICSSRSCAWSPFPSGIRCREACARRAAPQRQGNPQGAHAREHRCDDR